MNNLRERSPLSTGSKSHQEIDIEDDDIAIGYDEEVDDSDDDSTTTDQEDTSTDDDDNDNGQSHRQHQHQHHTKNEIHQHLLYNIKKKNQDNDRSSSSSNGCFKRLILQTGGGTTKGGINSYKRKNITCLIGTLVFGISLFLIVMLLTRFPLSYIDHEDYSDNILSSYCAHLSMESDQVELSKNQCSFLQHQHQQQQKHNNNNKNNKNNNNIQNNNTIHNYECNPSNLNRPQYQYKLGGLEYEGKDPFSCRPPVVSIIVPVYNTPKYQLLEMYESVNRQSLQSFELVIVDDGSTNSETINLINDWEKSDTHVHIQKHSSKRGLPSARNTGIKQSRAPYIFLLDSDDMIEPTTLEKLVWKLETSPHIAFAKGWTVGFGAQEYVWEKGYEKADAFLYENQVTVTAMFRKEVFFENVHNRSLAHYSGFDEQIIGGMEDWDFILKCANNGLWGETIPDHIDIHNHLDKQVPRCLLILPWLNTGGADKFNLNFVRELIIKGWDVTIVTTLQSSNPWLPSFQKLTPDIFVLDNFLTTEDTPRFLCYLIESRKIDITLVSNSELGYLFVPYLKEKCPFSAIVDYVHMEEDHWKSGGYARYSLSMQSTLDLSIVSSDHLKEWMIKRSMTSRLKQHHYREKKEKSNQERGGNGTPTQTHQPMESAIADNIDVCYVNVDMKEFQFNIVDRNRIRELYNIPMSTTVVLFAGRLVEQKQPKVALEVFKKLIENDVTFNAFIVGDGEQRDQVEEFIQRNGMQSVVKILGDVPSEDMPAIISASDIVFLPSAMEGISMLFFESMAAGVIPIGRSIGGQHELITADEGELLSFPKHHDGPEYTVPAYTERLQHLIQLSPREKKEKSLACITRIATYFTIEMMSESMIKSFCKASYRKRMKESGSLLSFMDYPIAHTGKSNRPKKIVQTAVPMSGFGDINEHNGDGAGDDHQSVFGLHNVGVGQELAIQAIESIKWQKKSDAMWKTLEALKKQVVDDKPYHNQCDIDKADGDSLKTNLQQLTKSHTQLQQEFDQYVKENEDLYSKYQDTLESLRKYQLQDKEKGKINIQNNDDD
ncbi:putative glycosyltransferase [Cavenderia fasciculata]|uniref:Glycosyltransferase n=1 Tax=Cavenderia fasciculata TaxID=261658 RepID=F4PST2_CACFS|nr:putative glycosyltransferase [Cavenderia fasciculata]EGG21560.1 putative glycosyltransferase [Cavenderia fasciculata]|eukprot:XP_004359410.1 putative glycosyltransferase [Cavenderia fasciculata]